MLEHVAAQMMAMLNEMPEVKGCKLYGSISNGTHDEMSDIDIEIDVSGCDNGQFMLELVRRLGEKMDALYSDYAPSLAPEKYIVSIAIDEDKPFRMVDLCCAAEPHCMTVTKQEVRALNDEFSHVLKLWTANLKHYVRNADCRSDIVRMAGRIDIANIEAKSNAQILEETLKWLERNAPCRLQRFVVSCRREYDKRAASL